MTQTYRIASPEAEAALREIEDRRARASEDAFHVAGEMIEGVRAGGDRFVAEQIERFDRVRLDEIAIAPREVDCQLADSLEIAIARVEAFHRPQLPPSYELNGITHRVRPLRRVGIYVPGGRAVYISTLI